MKPSALVLVLMILGPASSQPAENPQLVRPLIQLHTHVTIRIQGSQYLDQYLFVATDGTATGQSVTGHPLASIGWQFQSKTAKASAAQLKALQDALGRAAIGTQPGDCTLFSTSSFLSTGVAELNWYGRFYRKNTLALTIGAPADNLCPQELQDLFLAIEDFSGAVLGQNDRP
jgi:hypothetical protein